jgi:hypothetical protein
MATWRADVFVNSQVGRITTEVEAATFGGAKQQIYAKHGDVQQITNLRQVSSWGGGSSSSSSDDIGGYAIIAAVLFGIWLFVEYWWIAVPCAVLLAVLIYLGMKE